MQAVGKPGRSATGMTGSKYVDGMENFASSTLLSTMGDCFSHLSCLDVEQPSTVADAIVVSTCYSTASSDWTVRRSYTARIHSDSVHIRVIVTHFNVLCNLAWQSWDWTLRQQQLVIIIIMSSLPSCRRCVWDSPQVAVDYLLWNPGRYSVCTVVNNFVNWNNMVFFQNYSLLQ